MEKSLPKRNRSDFGLLLGFAIRRVSLKAAVLLLAPLRRLRPTPFSGRLERILIAPQDLRTADPTAAGDIYSGYFAFAGKIVSTDGGSVFTIEPPSRAWLECLMEFGWLRHIRAADTALARANARTLVDDFISKRGRPDGSPTWDTDIVSNRLIAWLSHSPLILDGADRAFYRRFMGSVRRQAAYLWRKSRRLDHREGRLHAAIALMVVAICTDMPAGRVKRVNAHFIRQIEREILADGGHISRNPQKIVDLLADLLPLRHCFIVQSATPPAALLNAIDRMMPMLRLLRHGDGTLALFNGMGASASGLIATLLAYQDTRSGTLETAGPSGYRRLQGGDTTIIMDVGKPPPEVHSEHAHAGCLSFEMSDGIEKLIINCGAVTSGQDSRQNLARATAAHSTLTLADTSSCRFAPINERQWPYGGVILRGPRATPSHRDGTSPGGRLMASHDGYGGNFGLIHEREITLDPDGTRVTGQDRLDPVSHKRKAENAPYAIRFHLQPGIEAHPIEGDAVELILPSGRSWIFLADAPVSVDDSVLFASPDGLRRTKQIVIEGQSAERPHIRWTLRRGQMLA